MARPLTFAQIARRAFDKAYYRLRDDVDAGRVSPADAAVRFKAICAAYEARKEARRFRSFLASHGLANIIQGAR